MYRLLFLFLLLVGCINKSKTSVSDIDYYERCRKLVLEENEIGRKFLFSRMVDGIDEVHVTFLGVINIKRIGNVKVLNVVNYSGQNEGSRRGNGKMFLYNSENKELGLYYLGGASDVPTRLDNKNIIFDKRDNCNETTVVNFSDSIPRNIFVKCTSSGGDFYSFTVKE
ncbi:MAG: hypothetical protein DI598_06605 [Pseudopedobacter saltans]|uniref:Uncharacterized protein n=1 Tax=Pseudopedobacter saltans TaxID=151895 RepID=A0A2W5F6W0_9SPHI|nr:MAG: hypothetical protein DI598_06605 [Pseudopedobacter saltans]